MGKENKRLKFFLVMQSFAPLFILLFVKNIQVDFIQKFINACNNDGFWAAVSKGFSHPMFGNMIVSLICVAWVLLSVIVALVFKKSNCIDFDSHGESIIIGEAPNDGGAAFLVTYVLPLLTDDLSDFRGLVVFSVMLIFVIWLLSHSNTFYQNPILVALNYRTFSFKFNNPYMDICGGKDRSFIGITKGKVISEEAVIRRKYISDGVFLIYNE